jgi:hypothetical protein
MALSLFSFLLLLGAAAADRKIIFGRSMHKRSSSLKRIRRAQRETLLVTEEVTTVEAPTILIDDGVQTERSTSRVLNERSSMPLLFEFTDFSMPSIETPTYATPTPSAVAPPPPIDPNADLARLFAQALVSDFPIGARQTIESTLTLFCFAPSFSSLMTSANAPVWILPRTLAWCPHSLTCGSGATEPADDEAFTLPMA